MKVRAFKCQSCIQTIYSRAQYDFISCKCGDISIDGGQNHIYRILWDDKKTERPEEVELDLGDKVTSAVLYQDWNKREDLYGRINDDSNYRMG